MADNKKYMSGQISPRPRASLSVFRLWLVTLGMAGAMFVIGSSAWAEDEPPLGQITPNLRILGELRGRYEVFDFFQPALDPARGVTANDNDYGFGALRARLGVALTTPYVEGLVQGQYSGLYALPDQAFAGLPVGPLGLGGAYYKDNGSIDPGAVFLKQGWLSLKGEAVGLPGASLKGGRFEIRDGLEYRTGDAKFDFLKLTRVSQRLVGPFDFTHVTRSFDGFSLAYDQPSYNVTLSAAHPTQGGFNVHGQDQISHVDLAYGALTAKKGTLLPDTEARLFYLYYGDDRSVQPVDNRPLALRPKLNQDSLAISTIGAHWLTVAKLGPGSVDALLWGAYQFGDWGNLNHSAYAVAAEAGYQWTDVFLKPWVRAGYFRASGDDNANDGTHHTFFQAIPTVRLYAKLPFYSLMNLQDVFAQVSVMPTPATKLDVDFHHLSLAESRDLFYGGSGATSRTGAFGYFGRPSGGQGTVGQLVDVTFTHTLNKYLSWSVYYAHAFGDDVTRNVYQLKNDADYAFVEFTVSF
jgi:hypothetical protein